MVSIEYLCGLTLFFSVNLIFDSRITFSNWIAAAAGTFADADFLTAPARSCCDAGVSCCPVACNPIGVRDSAAPPSTSRANPTARLRRSPAWGTANRKPRLIMGTLAIGPGLAGAPSILISSSVSRSGHEYYAPACSLRDPPVPELPVCRLCAGFPRPIRVCADGRQSLLAGK